MTPAPVIALSPTAFKETSNAGSPSCLIASMP